MAVTKAAVPEPAVPEPAVPEPAVPASHSVAAATNVSEDNEDGPRGWMGTLDKLLAALGPPTVVGALLYYFGWARTHSLFSYFGIDADSIGLSTTDYVLRSASAVWPSLGGLVVVVL